MISLLVSWVWSPMVDPGSNAFHDIDPQAPTHFLVVPKQHIQSVSAVTEENAPIVGHIFAVIARLAEELGFAGPGYRVVSNIGEAGQNQ